MSNILVDHNPQVDEIRVAPIDGKQAKIMVCTNHYMKTWPSNARLSLGVFHRRRCVGVLVFGYSSSTAQKVRKLCPSLIDGQFLEMQRMWISDSMGHNVESKTLSLVMKALKKNFPELRLVFTHAGGCKNDCGIVYQSSAWMYFGKTKCDDFFLTEAGEYKNIVAALRFGRVTAKGKTKQQIGEELFGSGEIIDSWRYNYAYPLDRGLRRKLSKITEPYPKDSAQFRRDQEFVT